MVYRQSSLAENWCLCDDVIPNEERSLQALHWQRGHGKMMKPMYIFKSPDKDQIISCPAPYQRLVCYHHSLWVTKFRHITCLTINFGYLHQCTRPLVLFLSKYFGFNDRAAKESSGSLPVQWRGSHATIWCWIFKHDVYSSPYPYRRRWCYLAARTVSNSPKQGNRVEKQEKS